MLHAMFSPPHRNGLVASHFQLPAGHWTSCLQALAGSFPSISREQWLSRFQRGLVLDDAGQALAADAPCRAGARLHYYREVPQETVIPFDEAVLHSDADLVVADKPHFLPVTPAGQFVEETLLARLIRKLDNPQLVPLHRIDRATAGLVLFSARPQSRAAYQALFRDHRIHKRYHAVAPALPDQPLPLTRRSRLAAGEPFFRMQEIEGAANSETQIEVLKRSRHYWLYGLSPVTGKKHQLRVHMAALGAPIRHDRFYPQALPEAADDYTRPLQLLAQSLQFVDPLSGATRHFVSRLALDPEQAADEPLR